MMVMTAKVDLKKTLALVGIIAALLIVVVLLFGNGDSAETSAPVVSGNDARVQFLRDFGWEVSSSPVETSQVKIPEETTEVFDRYNALQKSQGYDLSKYAGKRVMRFVYKVNNYPGATEPVYATILIYKNQVIGGDITDTAPGGQIRGFVRSGSTENTATPGSPGATQPTQPTQPTGSSESTGVA